MLSLNTDKNGYASTLTSARFVVTVDWFYEGVKDRLHKVALRAAYRMISYFFVRILRKKRKKIEQEINYFSGVSLTTKDYKTLKKYLISFDELLPTMNKVQTYDLKSVPKGMVYLVTEMKRTNAAIFRYREFITRRLKRLNTEQFSTSQTEFRFISEKELFEKRSDVYEYWL